MRCSLYEWIQYIIMAVLSGGNFKTTYNICNTELMWPKFWVDLSGDCLVAYLDLK